MIHYLSLGEIAALLDLSENTVKSYFRKGMLPAPDARVGRNQGWLEATILAWHATRPYAPR
ncbi:helix-turn-helix transcriptional regulator [Tomitella gaofuii]|uniref:helix-turn-helix transcriptional regulator n=1 Tax=Tomitella gaofuii TaxID=2760083 RepID=UPI0015FCFEFE|nr:XRE family transcriptional regulator [Tomitella gaofuii]